MFPVIKYPKVPNWLIDDWKESACTFSGKYMCIVATGKLFVAARLLHPSACTVTC